MTIDTKLHDWVKKIRYRSLIGSCLCNHVTSYDITWSIDMPSEIQTRDPAADQGEKEEGARVHAATYSVQNFDTEKQGNGGEDRTTGWKRSDTGN